MPRQPFLSLAFKKEFEKTANSFIFFLPVNILMVSEENSALA